MISYPALYRSLSGYLFVLELGITETFALDIGMASTILIAAFCVMMAYACLKLYDEPVRAWLKKKMEI